MNFSKIVTAAKDQSKVEGLTHRFYTYPAGFSPIFAGAAIKNLTKKNDLVLDPFMGGGTTIIEAIRHGRSTIGVDLNPIAIFVSKVKTTRLFKSNYQLITDWSNQNVDNLHYDLKNDKFSKDALSIINYSGLGRREILNLKRIIKGASLYLKRLKKIKSKRASDFLRLALLKAMHTTLHDKRPISEFVFFKSRIKNNINNMLQEMETFDQYLLQNNKHKIYNRCSSTVDRIQDLKTKKPKLIITSPPYPGINIPYSRWQIHGRRNTYLPYLILGLEIPENASKFSFQNPRNDHQRIYFKTLENIFSSIAKISSKRTIILQLVAFNLKKYSLDMYLDTLDKCGLNEVKIGSRRVQRNVPNRSWAARYTKADIPSKREYLLAHQLK